MQKLNHVMHHTSLLCVWVREDTLKNERKKDQVLYNGG